MGILLFSEWSHYHTSHGAISYSAFIGCSSGCTLVVAGPASILPYTGQLPLPSGSLWAADSLFDPDIIRTNLKDTSLPSEDPHQLLKL